jgi:hypothetical protein
MNIIGIPPKQKFGIFHDEYWFAHHFNHKMVMVRIVKFLKMELFKHLG